MKTFMVSSTWKKFCTYLQIFLVISLSFVFSLNLNSSQVYAQAEEQQVCCQQDNGGDYCSYVPASDCTGENVLKAATSCDQTSFCRTGVCAGLDGFCYDNYPKALCEGRDGSFTAGVRSEQVPQCQLGCCIIGTQADYVTRDRCIEATGSYPSLEVDFRDNVASEQECLNLARNQEQGCCVRPEGSCTYGAKASCGLQSVVSGTGFYKDTYCSDESLRNSCECAPHNPNDLRATTCLLDRDEVYWVDSCGNPESVVGYDKDGGRISSEPDGKCDYNQGNLCGDSDGDGIHTCENLACIENEFLSLDLESYAKHGTKVGEVKSGEGVLNGESWCQYDSEDQEQLVGDAKSTADRRGKDPVGSRYYRSLCINGQELIEPCKDFREEYCYSNTAEVPFANRVYTEARCIQNEWETCSAECNTANPLTMSKSEYEEALNRDSQCCLSANRDCAWTNNKCVPAVSPGFKFWEGEGADVCGRASTECTVVYTCGGWNRIVGCENPEAAGGATAAVFGGSSAIYTGLIAGAGGGPIIISFLLAASLTGASAYNSGWNIVSGGECLSQDYLQAANNLCRSYGDCGADFNYLQDEISDPKLTLSTVGFTNTEDIGEDLGDAARDQLDSDFGENVPGNLTKIPNWKTGENFFNFRRPEEPEGGFLGKTKRILFTEDDLRGQGWLGPGAFAGYSLVFGLLGGLTALAPGLGASVGLRASPLGYLVSQGAAALFSEKVAGGLKGSLGSSVESYIQAAGEKAVSDLSIAQRSNAALVQTTRENAIARATEDATFARYMTGASAALWAYTIFQLGDVIFEEVKPVKISTTCQPWQAPVYRVRATDVDPCQRCNPDFEEYIDENGNPKDVRALKTCSEYRCRSLGASCELLNEGTGEELCVSVNKLDTNSPKISPWEEGFTLDLSKFDIVENEGKTGFKIVGKTGEKIPIYTPFIVGLQTDEPSQCKMSFEHSVRYDAMANNFFGGNNFKYFHLNQMVYPATRGANQTEIVLAGGGHYKLNLRCTDAVGNANEADYIIEFDVEDEQDLTPPNIVGSSLVSQNTLGQNVVLSNEIYLTHGANYTDITLFLNEPAECKYSYVPLEFNLIDDTNKCNVDGSLPTAPPYYECKFIRGGTGAGGIGPAPDELNSRAGTNQFVYFKCKDRSGNFNRDAYTVVLRGSDELRITSKAPSDLIKTSTAVVNVTLQVGTLGGALLNGNSVCKYTTQEDMRENIPAMAEFLITNSSVHRQQWQPSTGHQRFFIGCYDIAGNLAFDTIEFDVEQDVTPPFITKVYRDENFQPPQFTVELNEAGECKDSTEGTFSYDTGGNLMNIINQNSTVFASTVPNSDLYYVVCRDDFGNTMNPAVIQIAEV